MRFAFGDFNPFLLPVIPVPYRHCPVLERLVIDREAIRDAYLVGARVSAAYAPALAVIGVQACRAQDIRELDSLLAHPVLLHEREYGDVVRCDARREVEPFPFLACA